MNRPFSLVVDSGNEDEPEPRTFGSLVTALQALNEYEEKWRRFAWIREQCPDGSIVVHVRDGQVT